MCPFHEHASLLGGYGFSRQATINILNIMSKDPIYGKKHKVLLHKFISPYILQIKIFYMTTITYFLMQSDVNMLFG